MIESKYGGLGLSEDGGLGTDWGAGLGFQEIIRRDGGRRCESCMVILGGGLCRDFKRIIGNGAGTLFWKDCWDDEGLLRVKFNRLFRLSLQKNYSIRKMGHWEERVWVWDFRSMLDRESFYLDRLLQFFNRLHLSQDRTDSWVWIHSKNGKYCTKVAYDNLLPPHDDSSQDPFTRKLSRDYGRVMLQSALKQLFGNCSKNV